MAGSVYKPCKYKGCGKAPKCKHPWWLSYTHQGRRYRMSVDDFAKKPVKSKTEAAEAWLPRFITEVREGRDPRQQLLADRDGLSLAKFIELYEEGHCRAEGLNLDSLKYRLHRIKSVLGELPLKALEKPGPILDFLRDLESKGLTNATTNRYRSRLCHMINWAISRDLLSTNPFDKKGVIRMRPENNKRTRRLAPSEEKNLLLACRGGWGAYKSEREMMRLRIIAALDTGMRAGEMQRLQLCHLDFKQRLVRIPGEISKFPKDREIPMTPRLKRALQRRRFLGPDAYVFGNKDGAFVRSFREAWIGVLTRAGFARGLGSRGWDLHWHDLRHEFGSRVLEKGEPISVVRDLMGHQSVLTTERYDNQTLAAKRKAIKTLAG